MESYDCRICSTWGEEALQLFKKMQHSLVMLNNITFIYVMSVCIRIGQVDEGHCYFNYMIKDHNITPKMDHYACMVDLLGRVGRLEDVMGMIKKIPLEPSTIIWHKFLGACRIHGKMELGQYAAKCILELEPQDAATYVLLSNSYALARIWDDAERIKK